MELIQGLAAGLVVGAVIREALLPWLLSIRHASR